MFTRKIVYKLLSIVLLCFVLSCEKEKSSPKPLTWSDFEYSGIFTGTLSNNGVTNDIEGYVTIEDNGSTTIDLLSGRMVGNAIKNGNEYNITINQVSGVFQNVSNITGILDVLTRTMYLSGTYADGTPMTVGGQTSNIQLQTTGGWENLAKSRVVFTHNETCKANITIDGVTLSGLNMHYQNGGYCDPYYSGMRDLFFNFDNRVSTINCHSGVLQGLNGNPLPFTSCPSASFILDKNRQYTYSIVWENGQTETGTLTTLSGGESLFKCISNNGPECTSSGGGGLAGNSGTPRFNLQFNSGVDLDLYVITPGGSTIYYSNQTAQGGELDVDCSCSSSCNSENIFWTNGPSGQYQFYVKYYGSCGSTTQSVNYTVKVMNGNNTIQTRTGTLSSPGQQSQTWTYNHP